MKVTYHSVHGAIQESKHVFIQAGLLDSGIFDYTGVHSVLEIGLGTGLNALLSLLEADKHKNRLYYTALDLYPLNETEIKQLNYCEQLKQPHYKALFEKMHQSGWEEMFEVTDHFRLTKTKCDLLDYSTKDLFNIIYFDAFAPAAQPELWTAAIFEKLYRMMKPGGVLVTYCSKSVVRRAMQAAGFTVEKMQGPRGKREMLRARKVNCE
ncbi:MAG: tRNA (5-methylaminomethyl-2-thiouridine)(34)-methyltransferase MnmD [Chitinophagaceae bacterium]|nr:tRNA (5-methylaminomethyl-2-thiouridine)(34)-methyltransferase MnmD [Chitinophagaceae bacterium]